MSSAFSASGSRLKPASERPDYTKEKPMALDRQLLPLPSSTARPGQEQPRQNRPAPPALPDGKALAPGQKRSSFLNALLRALSAWAS